MIKQYKLRNYHFQLIAFIVILNIIGILLIGSAKESVQSKQILGMAMGLVVMVAISLMDYSFILKFRWLYYIGIIGLLILVEVVGKTTGGSQRWIKIAGIQFQPSELAKIVVILFFAGFFATYQEKVNTVKTIFLSFVLAGIPLALILMQPDTSTTIATIFIFIVLLFISGLSYKIVLSVIGVCVPVGIAGDRKSVV